MPPWSLEETLTARCLYSATEARVRLLHSKWGGLARYTLKFASFDEVEQVQLEKAFSKVRASKVVEAVLYDLADSDIPHKLIHLVPSANYQSYKLAFASEYVTEAFARLALREARDVVERLIVASTDVG